MPCSLLLTPIRPLLAQVEGWVVAGLGMPYLGSRRLCPAIENNL
jgi:hypothetical protein